MPPIKPSLPYVEVHLTDHCNLNCKGCAHFAPIAKKWFADPTEHERDMKRLRQLFTNIRTIRLMGGEPLLHPDLETFLISTRVNFPDAEIRLVSNGILMPRMSEVFWGTCKATNTVVEVTLYPPTEGKKEKFAATAQKKGVEVWFHKKSTFTPFINIAGDSSLKEGFKHCRERMACPMLRQGNIYYCFLAATLSTFNEHFHARIPCRGFVNIYDPQLTGQGAIRLLNTPAETCRYCSGGWSLRPSYSWEKSKGKMTEWLAKLSA